jgi:hypothetical protein
VAFDTRGPAFWPYRFGVAPTKWEAKWGPRLLTPKMMPPADMDLDDLPAPYEAAALDAISAKGYEQPAVEKPERKRRWSEEKGAAIGRRLNEAKARVRNAPQSSDNGSWTVGKRR